MGVVGIFAECVSATVKTINTDLESVFGHSDRAKEAICQSPWRQKYTFSLSFSGTIGENVFDTDVYFPFISNHSHNLS